MKQEQSVLRHYSNTVPMAKRLAKSPLVGDGISDDLALAIRDRNLESLFDLTLSDFMQIIRTNCIANDILMQTCHSHHGVMCLLENICNLDRAIREEAKMFREKL